MNKIIYERLVSIFIIRGYFGQSKSYYDFIFKGFSFAEIMLVRVTYGLYAKETLEYSKLVAIRFMKEALIKGPYHDKP